MRKGRGGGPTSHHTHALTRCGWPHYKPPLRRTYVSPNLFSVVPSDATRASAARRDAEAERERDREREREREGEREREREADGERQRDGVKGVEESAEFSLVWLPYPPC